MTAVDGKRVSKWSLEVMTFGKVVNEHLKRKVLEFSKGIRR